MNTLSWLCCIAGHGTWHEGEYAPWAVGWKAVAKTLGVDVNTGLTDAQVDAHAAYGSAALDLVEIPAWAPTFAEKLLESPISKAMLTLNTAAFAYNAAYDSVLGATVDFAVAGGVAFGMAAYAAYEDRGAARNDRAEQLAGVAQMNVLRAGVWVIKPSTDIVVGDVVKARGSPLGASGGGGLASKNKSNPPFPPFRSSLWTLTASHATWW